MLVQEAFSAFFEFKRDDHEVGVVGENLSCDAGIGWDFWEILFHGGAWPLAMVGLFDGLVTQNTRSVFRESRQSCHPTAASGGVRYRRLHLRHVIATRQPDSRDPAKAFWLRFVVQD